MSERTKAGAILGATLILGVAIGLLTAGAIDRRRAERVEELRRRGGFVEHVLQVIEPRDSAQRAAIVTRLEETARHNAEILVDSRERIRAEMESLRSDLEPLLDPAQRERLADLTRLRGLFGPPGMHPRRPGPRRGMSPGRGPRPPPDGAEPEGP